MELSHDDVFYDGNDATKQAAAAANNAYVYILYWHICGDYYRQKMGLDIKKIDRDKATAFAYNMGPGAFATLWKDLKPKNFGDFILKIGQKLEKEFPEKVNMPKGKTGLIPDLSYAVEYWPGFYLKEKFAPEDSIKVGKRRFTGRKLMESKKYSEVIYSLWHRPTLSPAELAKLNAKAPKTKEIKYVQGRDYEVVAQNRWMWGIATALLKKVQAEYKIPYFDDADSTISTKTKTLITILIEYNKDVRENPAFEDIDPEDKDPNVALNTKVYFPSKRFINQRLKAMMGNANKVETLPAGVPKYSGTKADQLEKEGKEILKYKGKQPPFNLKIPKYKGVELDPNQPSAFGTMKAEDVQYIVIHSTEGEGSGMESVLYKTQNIHYIVRLDGTVELVRTEWLDPNEKDPKKRKKQRRVALHHAGLWSHKRRKVSKTKYKGGAMALWNGDGNVSLKTIGIEVETTTGGTYNEAQYKTMKTLIAWIGSRYNMPKSNVLAHSQIAVVDLLQWWDPKKQSKRERWGRGRKQDPRKVNWSKLGLPDNYHLVDPDVATGKIGSHLDRIRKDMKGKGGEGWGLNTDETMITGLDAADKIWAAKERAKRKTPRTN